MCLFSKIPVHIAAVFENNFERKLETNMLVVFRMRSPNVVACVVYLFLLC